MKHKFLYSILLLSFVWSCGNETPKEDIQQEETQQEKPVEENDPEWDDIAVLNGGFKFSLKVPSEAIANSKSQITYHEDRGELEVSAGEMYDLFIMEDDFQMQLVKDEIMNHPFYKVEMILENDSSLVYRYYTENGSKEEWHIYAERSLGQTKLLIRSNSEKEFNEYETRKMLESTLSIIPF